MIGVASEMEILWCGVVRGRNFPWSFLAGTVLAFSSTRNEVWHVRTGASQIQTSGNKHDTSFLPYHVPTYWNGCTERATVSLVLRGRLGRSHSR
jgi:hypothetical protein